jgi:PAS domain S-box-containing protein
MSLEEQHSGARTEDRFRLLVDSVTEYAIYMLDSKGNVTSWNAGAQRFKGYLPHEIIGEHFSRFYMRKISPLTCRVGRCKRPIRKDGSSRRVGASARTAPGSGRTWSSIQSAMPQPGHSSGTPKSLVT